MFLFCNEDKKKKERLNSVLKTTHNLIKKMILTEELHSLQRITRIVFSSMLAIMESVAGSYIPNRKIKIIVHDSLLPTDILHHPAGR